ncbi:hypothetical protein IF1G_11423 [Cordyceps javanica]|uniref:Uncharacterized protein n=1 Tax=Cordyceps javanica TaxID=43265 RepID=A0A545UKB9_9HYPO|nr:hypothetical protein IF1G_11423 [Cordyceps javanica]TQW01370.1 hypothetical protein IF2G_11108 [Cordyceps javanica]
MEATPASFAVTLSIFFSQELPRSPDAPKALLALPTGSRSTVATEDMWNSLKTLGVDVNGLKAIAGGCTGNMTVAYDCTSLQGAAKLKRLLDLASEQLVAVKSQHAELEKLQDDLFDVERLVVALRAEKQQLEADKAQIIQEISRLQHDDSLRWGVRDADEEQEELFSDEA